MAPAQTYAGRVAGPTRGDIIRLLVWTNYTDPVSPTNANLTARSLIRKAFEEFHVREINLWLDPSTATRKS